MSEQGVIGLGEKVHVSNPKGQKNQNLAQNGKSHIFGEKRCTSNFEKQGRQIGAWLMGIILNPSQTHFKFSKNFPNLFKYVSYSSH